MPGLRVVILASSFCKIYFLLGLNRLDQETGTIFFLKKKKSKKFSYYIVAHITCEFTQASPLSRLQLSAGFQQINIKNTQLPLHGVQCLPSFPPKGSQLHVALESMPVLGQCSC